MNTLAERLDAAFKRRPDLTQAGLARACGVKSPSVSDWLSGKTKKMEGYNLLLAAEYLDLNPWWLAAGVGAMNRSGKEIAKPSSKDWPFSVAIELYTSMPSEERQRVNDLVEFSINNWHSKIPIGRKTS